MSLQYNNSYHIAIVSKNTYFYQYYDYLLAPNIVGVSTFPSIFVGRKRDSVNRLRNTLKEVCGWNGVLDGAIVDSETGIVLLQKGDSSFRVAHAAKSVAQSVRIKLRETNARVRDQLRDEPDSLVEMCTTFRTQYHLVHLLTDTNNSFSYPPFLYLICNREKTNLAKIRLDLAKLTTLPLPSRDSFNFSIRDTEREPRPKDALIETSSPEEDEELPPFMRDEVVHMLLGMSKTATT